MSTTEKKQSDADQGDQATCQAYGSAKEDAAATGAGQVAAKSYETTLQMQHKVAAIVAQAYTSSLQKDATAGAGSIAKKTVVAISNSLGSCDTCGSLTLTPGACCETTCASDPSGTCPIDEMFAPPHTDANRPCCPDVAGGAGAVNLCKLDVCTACLALVLTPSELETLKSMMFIRDESCEMKTVAASSDNNSPTNGFSYTDPSGQLTTVYFDQMTPDQQTAYMEIFESMDQKNSRMTSHAICGFIDVVTADASASITPAARSAMQKYCKSVSGVCVGACKCSMDVNMLLKLQYNLSDSVQRIDTTKLTQEIMSSLQDQYKDAMDESDASKNVSLNIHDTVLSMQVHQSVRQSISAVQSSVVSGVGYVVQSKFSMINKVAMAAAINSPPLRAGVQQLMAQQLDKIDKLNTTNTDNINKRATEYAMPFIYRWVLAMVISVVAITLAR